MAVFVPGRWVNVTQRIGGSVFTQRKYQPAHYADPHTGAWVPKPSSGGSGGASPGYTGLTDEEIQRRANAQADAQIQASGDAIRRAQAAAAAKAARDSATYQALGTAQMGMIGQIPANIQAIRDTAGRAISGYGNQVAAGQASQLKSEQAAAAA